MMFARLREFERDGGQIRVAVVGAGFVGRGLLHQLRLTPGISCRLVIARSTAQATSALEAAGHGLGDIITTDDPDSASAAIGDGLSVVAAEPRVLSRVSNIDVVVDATGDVSYGAHVALVALTSGKHLVSLNYETDATVGPLLRLAAVEHNVVYTGSDGDQPGVLMRLHEYVRGIGLDVVAAINCKGYMDRHATPKTIAPWAERQGTSLKMTTAFTDGTKMNVENASVANATGLLPERRGMHGVQTTLGKALDDFKATLSGVGVVDYTLGGDFGSGVFIIGSGADPQLAAPYLDYLKMGTGPWYMFFRPWHLVQFETPISIAEAALDGIPTITPTHGQLAQVVAIAKRDLPPGRLLDGIGGFDCYGEIDVAAACEGLVPLGLNDQCTIVEPVERDSPISFDKVEIADSPITRLWNIQKGLLAAPSDRTTPDFESLTGLWNEQ